MERKFEQKINQSEGNVFDHVDYFCIRHGETNEPYSAELSYERFKELLANREVFGLSENGEQQIRKAVHTYGLRGKDVKIILSSPYIRTQKSAEVIQDEIKKTSGIEVPVKVSDLLAEVEFDPNCITKEKYEELLSGGDYWKINEYLMEIWIKGGPGVRESAADTYKRAERLLTYLRRMHKYTQYDKAVLATHGWFSRIIQHVAQKGIPENHEAETRRLGFAEGVGLKRGDVHSEMDEDGFVVIRFNQDEK